jgi:hypothetical protein
MTDFKLMYQLNYYDMLERKHCRKLADRWSLDYLKGQARFLKTVKDGSYDRYINIHIEKKWIMDEFDD